MVMMISPPRMHGDEGEAERLSALDLICARVCMPRRTLSTFTL